MSNLTYMHQKLQGAFYEFKEKLELELENLHEKLDDHDRDVLLIRLERYFADFYEAYASLYHIRPDFKEQLDALITSLVTFYRQRPLSLKKLDFEREITPDWFQRETMVGGIYYVDLFAGTLQGVSQHLSYLKELGLTYVHLMPLLKPRSGMNDGGYAVEDYRSVDPVLGTMEDLEALATEFRDNGISLCIDLVVNHTAKEHEWARKALEGDPLYLDYFYTFDDRTTPDAYEKTLPEIFPDFAPGNFTYYPEMAGAGKWVWTTFNEFQWDLNYTNPAVFREMLDNMLFLSNKGVEILRLDAVPFMWKRMGTNCQNQPEVHDLLQAFRALVKIVAPAVIFKAEAIVAPLDLIPYLGTGRHTGRECELAYNNSLMVLLWSTLATRKVGLITHTLQHTPAAPSGSTWITYIRLHDDIGWAITDENARALGENGFLHRRFLNEFYSGSYAGSFSRGEIFQFNPVTGDGRMSGMTASLAGLEKAIQENNQTEIDLAIRRIVLLYNVILTYNGIPLIYMGDELGLLNDYSYRDIPHKTNDNRWMHRPSMPWNTAEKRHDPQSITGRIYKEILHLIQTRKKTRQLHGAATSTPLWCDNPHVFALLREHPAYGILVALSNFSPYPQIVPTRIFSERKVYGPLQAVSQPDSPLIDINRGHLELQPYEYLWLVNPGENL